MGWQRNGLKPSICTCIGFVKSLIADNIVSVVCDELGNLNLGRCGVKQSELRRDFFRSPLSIYAFHTLAKTLVCIKYNTRGLRAYIAPLKLYRSLQIKSFGED